MKNIIGAVLLFIAAAAVLISGCAGPGSSDMAEELAAIEIREYEGEDLSSIKDFRENSIRGPQNIDIKNYELNITGLVTSPGVYTYDGVIDNRQVYKKVVTLNCVEGWSAKILWEGVLTNKYPLGCMARTRLSTNSC